MAAGKVSASCQLKSEQQILLSAGCSELLLCQSDHVLVMAVQVIAELCYFEFRYLRSKLGFLLVKLLLFAGIPLIEQV